MDDWYWPQEFEPGDVYVDADGEFTLEFSGVLTAKAARGLPGISEDTVDADDNEPVLVFTVVRDNEPEVSYYTHTRSDADRGYGFIALVARRQSECGRQHGASKRTRLPSA